MRFNPGCNCCPDVSCGSCPRCGGGPFPRTLYVTFSFSGSHCFCSLGGTFDLLAGTFPLDFFLCDATHMGWRYTSATTGGDCSAILCSLTIELFCSSVGWLLNVTATCPQSGQTCSGSLHSDVLSSNAGNVTAEASCSPLQINLSNFSVVGTNCVPFILCEDGGANRLSATVTE